MRSSRLCAACVSALLAAGFFCVGCRAALRQHLFSGRAVTQTSQVGEAAVAGRQQAGEEVSVSGWLVSSMGSRALSLTFSNQTAAAIPMSAVVDEYTAKTADGRVVALKDVDFLDYPVRLPAGGEQTVTLFLPKDLAAADITQVVARLNQGRTVVVLHAIGPREPAAWRVGSSAGIVVSEQARVVRMDPRQSPPDSAPSVLEPVGPVAARSEAPTGTVAVNVKFSQSLGSTLRAEVFWNDSQQRVTLASGEQQLFYVVPGQHEFHVVSRLPFIMETHARAPVVVSATEPIRIEITADARLTGVVLHLRLFSGERLVVNQRFSPVSGR